jgi:transglutaminase-like putative cysteine protease
MPILIARHLGPRVMAAFVFGVIAVFWYLIVAVFEPETRTVERLAEYQQQRILRFSYEISNAQSHGVNNAKFSSYLPVLLMSNQQAVDVKSSQAFTEQKGRLGNRVGHFELGFIPPYGKKIVNFVAKINMAEKVNLAPLESSEKYLMEEPFIELSHPAIIRLSQQLKDDSNQQSIENIYQWVSKRIEYAGYVSKDRGALYAIQNLRGDCTEYMYAVVALARALGVPARGVGGYVYENNQVVSPVDYHNWAEVYLDGAWHIVDAQKKAFMNKTENYIAMRVLSDASVSLLGSSHRFSVANNQLTIKMK